MDHSPRGCQESDTLQLNNNKKAGVRESAETGTIGVNYAYLEMDQKRWQEESQTTRSKGQGRLARTETGS